MMQSDAFPSRMYGYVRSRQLEGTYPGSAQTGTWITSSMRICKGWGMVDENDWPYDGDASHWPPNEPEGLDVKAKLSRVLAYQRVNTIDDSKLLLARGTPSMVAVEIDDSWFDTSDGVILRPTGDDIRGSHAITLVGYDDGTARFTFANSWGTDWGDQGFGYLPYEYLLERILESWTITALDHPARLTGNVGVQLQRWAIHDRFDNVLHGAEIIDGSADEVIAWGFAIERDQFLDVEELFVRPRWRRRGFASELGMEFRDLASESGRNLRFWIPHSDANDENLPAVRAVLRHLSFSLLPSPFRYAAAVGLDQ